YGVGHPSYEVAWGTAEYSGAGGTLLVTLKQTQPGEPFLDRVPIEVTSADGKRLLWIEPAGKETTAGFPFWRTEVPTAVKIDPDETLLKEAVVANKSIPRQHR